MYKGMTCVHVHVTLHVEYVMYSVHIAHYRNLLKYATVRAATYMSHNCIDKLMNVKLKCRYNDALFKTNCLYLYRVQCLMNCSL